MSFLAKQLALLFSIIAVVIVLLIAIIINLDWITTTKRILIGGLTFSLVGGIIGQLLTYNLNFTELNEVEKSQAEIAVNQEVEDKESELSKRAEEDMMPLEFNQVDETEANIVNQDPEKLAKMIKGMNEE